MNLQGFVSIVLKNLIWMTNIKFICKTLAPMETASFFGFIKIVVGMLTFLKAKKDIVDSGIKLLN